MKYIIVAVHDRQLDCYMRPFVAQARGQAVRSFTDETNRQGSELNMHPEDYELHELGHFDDQTGGVTANDRPVQLAIAANVHTAARKE